MGIRVQHGAPLSAWGGIASGIGQGQANAQQNALAEERARFLLGFRENQRQFDVRTEMDAARLWNSQRNYNQQLAQQDLQQRRLLADRAAEREQSLIENQMRQQYALAEQQAQQDFQSALYGEKALTEQASDEIGRLRKMKFNPEGQRLFTDMASKLRQIQGRKDIRPGVRNQFIGQWFDELERLGLDSYEEHEPTVEEQFYKSIQPLQGQVVEPGQPLPPGKYRQITGVRNGVPTWDEFEVSSPEAPVTNAEKWKRDAVEVSPGVFAVPDSDGGWKVEDLRESSSPQRVDVNDPGSAAFKMKLYNEALSNLRANYSADARDNKGAFNPKPADIQAEMARMQEAMGVGAEQEAQAPQQPVSPSPYSPGANILQQNMPEASQVRIPRSPDEIRLYSPGTVFHWNGQTARIESDGSVTVLG